MDTIIIIILFKAFEFFVLFFLIIFAPIFRALLSTEDKKQWWPHIAHQIEQQTSEIWILEILLNKRLDTIDQMNFITLNQQRQTIKDFSNFSCGGHLVQQIELSRFLIGSSLE